MAIGQGNKIIASEINDSAATSFSQGAFIYAKDIVELYGGSDTIATGKLILAEHFQNLGLTGSGGLNGEFHTSSKNYKLKEAVDAKIIGYTYDDSSNWQLTFPIGGTLSFSNFGKKGSAIDIFMIGGGGAGNKDGISGSGGFYSITNNKILTANTNYSLVIGTGGTTNGAPGGATSGFGISVAGGYGGEAHTLHYYSASAELDWDGYNLYQYSGSISGDSLSLSNNGVNIADDKGYCKRPVKCDKNGNFESVSHGYYQGQYVDGPFYASVSDDVWFRATDITRVGDVTANMTKASRPSNEMKETTGFGGTTYYGGIGSTNSISPGTRYGQGGGSLGTYGNSSTKFGTGKSGLIIIRNHRK